MLIEDADGANGPSNKRRGSGDSDQTAIKLSDIVYAKVAGRIRSGEYPVNSRLPTEIKLAEALGVSRPIIREALARLRNDHVIVSRRGSGSFVQSLNVNTPSQIPPLKSIGDMRRCLEYRVSIEGEAAWHAAHGVERDRAKLIDAMALLETDFQNDMLEPTNDFAFHHAVALATGNRFFHETMAAMQETIITAMQITPHFISPRSHDRLRHLHSEHRAVFAAIMANDPDAARDAMRTHLTSAMRRVFDGLYPD